MSSWQAERLIEIWNEFSAKLGRANEKAEAAENAEEKSRTDAAKRKAAELRREAEERTFITGELQEAFENVLEVFGYSVLKNDSDEIIEIINREEI